MLKLDELLRTGVIGLDKKMVRLLLGIIVFILGIYALFQNSRRMIEDWQAGFRKQLAQTAEKSFLTGMHYSVRGDEKNKENWIKQHVMTFFPLSGYVSDNSPEMAETEDALTYEMILEMQAKDEERMSEDLIEGQTGEQTPSEQVNATVVSSELSVEKLRDFNYLISKLYTVDSTTTIGPEQLNVDELLAKDMHIDTNTKGPKVLIFHTHSQEAFVDSTAGDSGTSIVGMGKYLAEKLNALGIETMHHDGVYDLINGKLDRSKAYELSEVGVREILNENPSIEVVIDLHRDGIAEDKHLVTEINGKQTAKIMFFNGLSRTKSNGDIAYLHNPYIQDNLSFSLQMQLATESMYPGFARRIYLKGYRYSLHMMPKSLLIEAGAQTNTVEEMKNAMDLLANILNKVLVG